MSLQRFRHFLALAEERNFARAAALVGIRQPPFSQSIARLERECGASLFQRGATGTSLTAAGRALLPEARAAVAALDRGLSLTRSATLPEQPVRVGLVHPALWEGLPALLSAARGEGLAVAFEQMATNDQLTALAQGRLDLGFVSPPFAAPARLQTEAASEEALVMALPAAWAGDDEDDIALDAVANRLILFPREQGPVLHDAILAMFRTAGLEPRIVQETPQMTTTLALVAAGIGASFVPASFARNLAARGVAYRSIRTTTGVPVWPLALAHMPLAAESPAARLLLAWRRGQRGEKDHAGMDFPGEQFYKPRQTSPRPPSRAPKRQDEPGTR